MYNWPAILILLLLAGCAGPAGTPGSPASAATEDALAAKADEFRQLRVTPGHFQGGTWNDDVDRWMGRKHALMIELGERLGTGAYSKTQAIDLLGDPDAIAREGDPLYDRIRGRAEFKGPPGEGYQFLIYHWRGEHDFLYLVVREETVLGAGWWYAGE